MSEEDITIVPDEQPPKMCGFTMVLNIQDAVDWLFTNSEGELDCKIGEAIAVKEVGTLMVLDQLELSGLVVMVETDEPMTMRT